MGGTHVQNAFRLDFYEGISYRRPVRYARRRNERQEETG